MLIDSERELYAAYGMPRADWWTLSKPSVMWKYIVNVFTGTMPGWKGKDIKQLGGNVLINPDGKVVLNHVSTNPHDRPNSQEIFELIKE